jgi:hypothetical protein
MRLRHYATDLKPVLDENWAMVAEKQDTGEVVGAAISTRRWRSSMGGCCRSAGARRCTKPKIDAVRVFTRGVKPEYQHTSVGACFYQMHFDAVERTPQKGARWAGYWRGTRP